jgi:transcriptional regulator with XRE-family HTH domain
VFYVVLFRQHFAMPARKPKACPHRTRFGKNIAALRARRNLTQEKLAEKAGASARYIQSVEAGEYFPSLSTLVRLKSVLRCDWGELFAGCERV